jgi:hypothetical protein
VRSFLAAAFALFLTVESRASCVCRCVDGETQPLCSSAIDLPPICPLAVCSIVPPGVAPVQSPRIPPIGTSDCSLRQVLNPATNRYEWRSICN